MKGSGGAECPNCKHIECICGIKYDQDKACYNLLPPRELEQVVRVLMYGAAKYPSDDNWQQVQDARKRYYNAFMRHTQAWWSGEELDPESGLPHLAHAQCCLFFLQWFDNEGVSP